MLSYCFLDVGASRAKSVAGRPPLAHSSCTIRHANHKIRYKCKSMVAHMLANGLLPSVAGRLVMHVNPAIPSGFRPRKLAITLAAGTTASLEDDPVVIVGAGIAGLAAAAALCKVCGHSAICPSPANLLPLPRSCMQQHA